MTILGVDVWEGDPTIDEPLLKDKGVEFMIVRLNDMNGGHHMDVNFNSQWSQAQCFIHWPYFVYNPWVTGRDNYNWLAAHVPSDATFISSDVEVVKPDYPPSTYYQQVMIFLDLVSARWVNSIYSGDWFESCLSQWPMDDYYWWARYPFILYPDQKTSITWEELKIKLATIPWNPGTPPGPCRLWQVTADRYILPGCGGVPVDINLWNGTVEELRAMVGGTPPPPPPLPARVRVVANPYANIRNAPNTLAISDVGDLNIGQELVVLEDTGSFWKASWTGFIAKSVTITV